jgi:hypothetical protein
MSVFVPFAHHARALAVIALTAAIAFPAYPQAPILSSFYLYLGRP